MKDPKINKPTILNMVRIFYPQNNEQVPEIGEKIFCLLSKHCQSLS